MPTPLDTAALITILQAGQDLDRRFYWSHRPRKDGSLSDACFSQ